MLAMQSWRVSSNFYNYQVELSTISLLWVVSKRRINISFCLHQIRTLPLLARGQPSSAAEWSYLVLLWKEYSTLTRVQQGSTVSVDNSAYKYASRTLLGLMF